MYFDWFSLNSYGKEYLAIYNYDGESPVNQKLSPAFFWSKKRKSHTAFELIKGIRCDVFECFKIY